MDTGQCVTSCPVDKRDQFGGCWTIPPKDQGCPRGDGSCTANPINSGSGNKYQVETVYQPGSTPSLTLYYNSFTAGSDSDFWNGMFGRNWTGRYFVRVKKHRQNTISVKRPEGQEFEFRPPGSGNVYVTDADTAERLERLVDGASATIGWRYTASKDDEVELYDKDGRLLSVTARSGLVTKLTYSDGQNGFLYPAGSSDPNTAGPEGFRSPDCQVAHPIAPVAKKLAKGHMLCVTDPFGRQVHFQYLLSGQNQYDTFNRARRMLDQSGQAYVFEYDGPSGPSSANNLTKITLPDSSTRTYHYNEAALINGGSACAGLPNGLPNALTGITDENGVRYATWTYDCSVRATSSKHGVNVDLHALTYSAGSTAVLDPLGTSRTVALQTVLGVVKSTGVTQPAVGGGNVSTAISYDANGNVSSRTDWNGNRTNYTHDLTRNLETQRVEGLTSGGGTTPQTRTINTEWHATFRLPKRVAEPLRITTYAYNGDPGASCGFKSDGTTLVPGVLCTKTIQATTDANGSQGFSATPTGSPRIWTYEEYNPNGLVVKVNGPRTDVTDRTTYAYYADNDADFGKRGNIQTITNAAGHITSITAYNAHGQPLTISDPNGLVTTLTYDLRQRLKTRSVGGELTTYDYDSAGQLIKVTLPDSSFLRYCYDAAHRLTGISDGTATNCSDGNRIAYTLDAIGNRTLEEVRDPANQLAQTRSRVYNTLNRLFQEIGAIAGEVTEYGYDNQGNVKKVTDPLTHITENQYDELNRLNRVTDPGTGVTLYGYNGLDALTSVTDPRYLVTNYSVDGLGNLNQQVSPDTGTTTFNIYDAAGNLTRQTDAKGQQTNYVYDALNRVTLITFHDLSTQTYLYDQGTNGLGRLTTIEERNPASQVIALKQYGYDQKGRVTSDTRTVNGIAYATGYTYDTSGRLSGMTYPSGRTVTYSFDSLGRVNLITTTKDAQTLTMVQNVLYHPFGGVKGFTLGNGQVYSRSIDTDGRIASYTLGASTYNIGFDLASRITGIAEVGNPPNTNTYGYDAMDRLTSAILPSSTLGYSYDSVGNRQTKTVGAATDTYTYVTIPSPSNRIASITPASGPVRNFSFDPNGSTTNDGLNTYVYDTKGRLSQATGSLGATDYQINALGQRIRKTNSSTDTVYQYDTRGRLIAENTSAGVLKREYLYLGDIPVGVVIAP
jgi:YD repeat-containing protein